MQPLEEAEIERESGPAAIANGKMNVAQWTDEVLQVAGLTRRGRDYSSRSAMPPTPVPW